MRTRIKMPTYDKVPSTKPLFLRLVIFDITVRALKGPQTYYEFL